MSRSRIYQREDSKYWWADYEDIDGRPRRKSTGCRDRARAKEWLSLREGERIRAQAGIPVARPIALRTALARYIAAREKEWSKGWRGTFKSFLKNEVFPSFGEETLVSDITEARVQEFRTAQIGRQSRRSKKPTPISPATVNRLMAALAAFGEWASHRDRRYMLENYFSSHKALAEGSEPPPAVSAKEAARFLEAIESPRLRLIMTVAIDTGLRKSELQRLNWPDVDLERRALVVISSYRRGQNKGRKTMVQALTRRAAAALASLPLPHTGPVFGPIGDHRRALISAAKRAGLGHVWFHAARHFGASLVSALGASRHEIQQWGRWASTRMSDRYSHVDHSRLLALADKLDKETSSQ